MIYLDTSAAIKALVIESGTDAVRALFVRDEAMISSRLFAVELQAVADRRVIAADAAQEIIDRVALVSLDDETLDAAIRLRSGLRTLDALHLAAALQLGDIVTELLTFDRELADAASANGVPLHALAAV